MDIIVTTNSSFHKDITINGKDIIALQDTVLI